MLKVLTPDEVIDLVDKEFSVQSRTEILPLDRAFGRILAEDVLSEEYVPDFDRSTVDGYAVHAADTFGCSDSIPALLSLSGKVLMGENADFTLGNDCCAEVPTGGVLPNGADAMVMVEYIEDYGDGTIGILKPVAPGANLIYRGDDIFPGKKVLSAGQVLTPQAVGALAAMGRSEIKVRLPLRVGIISTGDELIDITETPKPGQIRDINTSLLAACIRQLGADPVSYGRVKDDPGLLAEAVNRAISQCDAVLISGGSSVGTKDVTCDIIEKYGEILFHGIAMKPGKPTILGKAGNRPVFGLPGHPAAAFFVTKLFVTHTLNRLMGIEKTFFPVQAVLSESVSANHGRAQYMGVHLTWKDGQIYASPIRSKSGLISTLSASDGYFGIDRDCEGLSAGSKIQVYMYH